MTGQRKAATIIAVVLAVWAIGLTVWTVRPLSDHVPVGKNYNLEVPREVSQSVACHALFASSPRPDEPLPELEVQPEGVPPLAYQRPPCVLVQDHARALFVLNAVMLVGIGGAALFLLRRRRSGSDEPALVGAA